MMIPPWQLFSVQLTFLWSILMTTTFSLELHDHWTLSNGDGSIRISNVSLPGNVHSHLVEHGLVEDPYYRFNEFNQTWVGTSTWVYTRTFEWTSEKKDVVMLSMGNIDTVAEIRLNHHLVASTQNMFRFFHWNVSQVVQKGRNRLEIQLLPALEYAVSQVMRCNFVSELNYCNSFILAFHPLGTALSVLYSLEHQL